MLLGDLACSLECRDSMEDEDRHGRHATRRQRAQ
jgi:hypothetical protein